MYLSSVFSKRKHPQCQLCKTCMFLGARAMTSSSRCHLVWDCFRLRASSLDELLYFELLYLPGRPSVGNFRCPFKHRIWWFIQKVLPYNCECALCQVWLWQQWVQDLSSSTLRSPDFWTLNAVYEGFLSLSLCLTDCIPGAQPQVMGLNRHAHEAHSELRCSSVSWVQFPSSIELGTFSSGIRS